MASSSGGDPRYGSEAPPGVLGEIQFTNNEKIPQTNLKSSNGSCPGSPGHHGYMPSKFRSGNRPWVQGHWNEGQEVVKNSSLNSSAGLKQFKEDMASAVELDKVERVCDREGVNLRTVCRSPSLNSKDMSSSPHSKKKSMQHPRPKLAISPTGVQGNSGLYKTGKTDIRSRRHKTTVCDSTGGPEGRSVTQVKVPHPTSVSEERTNGVTAAGDPSRYLRTPSPQKVSRRSMSDLGFRNAKPFPSKSRTLSLLQHPAFRNRIARSMSLDPNENDFEKSVCEKLSAKVEETFCLPPEGSVDLGQRRGSGQSMRLCCSTSDIGLLKDLQLQISTNPRLSVDGDFAACDRHLGSGMADISNISTDGNRSRHSLVSLRPAEPSAGDSTSALVLSESRSLATFKIPSFEEFKSKSKHRSSMLGEYSVPKVETILEEGQAVVCSNVQATSEQHSMANTHQKVNAMVVQDQSSVANHEQSTANVYVEHTDNVTTTQSTKLLGSTKDDLSIVTEHRRKKKKVRTSRRTDLGVIPRTQSLEGGLDDEKQTRKPERSKFRIPLLQPSELLSKISKNMHHPDKKPKSKRVKSNSECSHESVESNISSHNFNDVPKKSRTSKVREKIKKFHLFRSYSEAQLNKIGQEEGLKHAESANTILSDYASDSHGEFSDSLEDVFLQPALTFNRCKEESARGHQVIGQRSDLSKSVHFTDSGCLVDRSSSDLSMISGRPDVDTTMWRSVSDISDMVAEEQRQKRSRERRYKSNKSDPLNAGDISGNHVQQNGTPTLTRKDSKEDILNFLDGIIANDERSRSSGSPSSHSGISGVASAEVERADSGVGRETRSPEAEKKVCQDCREKLHDIHSPGVTSDSPGTESSFTDECCHLVCAGCSQKRTQRKEAILEMVETEQNYGKDLKILQEQFYEPMKTMGLLNTEQIQKIFINLEELISVNTIFASRLQKDLDLASEHHDKALQTMHIGQSFLDSSNMLLAYEAYCINQSAAPVLIDQLVEEKELLRIFLEVTQRERSVLRKMDLKAFLMLPVQRIMKYPLLLSRIFKVTPLGHTDREKVMQAQKKIENILELINYNTKSSANVRLRRRASLLRRSGEFDVTFENIETHKVAMEILGWDRSDVHFLSAGRLFCLPPPDHLWAKKGKTLKYTSVYGLLATKGKYPAAEIKQKMSTFTRPCPVKDAALVIVKEKAGKYQAFREPFPLQHCVVSVDPEFNEVFEVHEAMKDSLLFKGEHQADTDQWLRQVRMVVKDLNQWRHRRNALANIMLQNM